MQKDFRSSALAPQERSPPEQARPSDLSGELEALFTLLYAGNIPPPQDEALLREGHSLPPAARSELAEVLWRVQAARGQIKPGGAVRFTPLRPIVCGPGQCDLCGEPLDPERGYRFRCAHCATALQLALGHLTLSSWLDPEGDWQRCSAAMPGTDHGEGPSDREAALFPPTIVVEGRSPGAHASGERPVLARKETQMQSDKTAALAPPANDGESVAETNTSILEAPSQQPGGKTKARARPRVEITLRVTPTEGQHCTVRAVVRVNDAPLRLVTLQHEQLEPLLLQAREASIEQILAWLYQCVEQWQQEAAAWRPARPATSPTTQHASQANARVRPGQTEKQQQTPGKETSGTLGQAPKSTPHVATPTETKEQVGAKEAPPQQMPLF